MPVYDGSGDHSSYDEDERQRQSAEKSFTKAVNKLLKRFASSPKSPPTRVRHDDQYDQQHHDHRFNSSLPSHRTSARHHHQQQQVYAAAQPLPVYLPPPPLAYRTTQYLPNGPYHPQPQGGIPPPPAFADEVSAYYPAVYFCTPPPPPLHTCRGSYHHQQQHSMNAGTCGCGYSSCGDSYPQMYSTSPPGPPPCWKYSDSSSSHHSGTFYTCEEVRPSPRFAQQPPPNFYARDPYDYKEHPASYHHNSNFTRKAHLSPRNQQSETVIVEEVSDEEEEGKERPVSKKAQLGRILQSLPPIRIPSEDNLLHCESSINSRQSRIPKRVKNTTKSPRTYRVLEKSNSPLLPIIEKTAEETELGRILHEHVNLLKDITRPDLHVGHESLRCLMSSYNSLPVFKQIVPQIASLVILTIQSPQTQACKEGIRSAKILIKSSGQLVDPFLPKLGKLLFLKTIQAARFIRVEAESALEEIVRRCSPLKVATLLNSKYGGRHINTRIKNVAAKLLHVFVKEVAGLQDTMELYGKEILPLLVEWLDEPDCQLRESAKKSLKLLWNFRKEVFQSSLKLSMEKDKYEVARKKVKKLFGIDDSRHILNRLYMQLQSKGHIE